MTGSHRGGWEESTDDRCWVFELGAAAECVWDQPCRSARTVWPTQSGSRRIS